MNRPLLFCGTFLLPYFATSQPTLCVTPSGAGNQSGSSWANALSGIQLPNRIATATEGTQFWVAAGTYKPTTTTDRTASFSIASGVSVYGGFAGTEVSLEQRNIATNETVFSGDIGQEGYALDNCQQILILKNASNSYVLDGLTIRDGQFADEVAGAGINADISDGLLTIYITHCRFINNVCFTSLVGGGAISITTRNNAHGNIIIRDCYFSNNKAASGGAFAPQTLGGTITSIIEDCVFANNIGNEEGGAISNRYVENSNQNSLTIRRCSFHSNHAYYTGGAIVSGTSKMFIESSIFANNYVTSPINYAGGGGGIDNSSSQAIIKNCIFTANHASYGGAVFSSSDFNPTKQTFTNCTFTNNSASTSGSVFYNVQEKSMHNPQTDHSNQTNLINCIIWQNSAPDSSIFTRRASSSADSILLNATYSLIQTSFPGTGNLNADPLFVDPINGDFRLQANSPAINAGSPDITDLPPTDLAGKPRIQGNRVDMGAFEFTACSPCLPILVKRIK